MNAVPGLDSAALLLACAAAAHGQSAIDGIRFIDGDKDLAAEPAK